MTPTQLISQLKKWGVKYKEYGDWETHNRNSKGPWGPVNGFMWHHTGSDSDDQRMLLRKGYSSLPGPLCHFGIAQDGIVWLIGWGRANHAGLGDDDVLNAVINETDPPVDNEANTDFNRHFYGAEIWYSGNHLMTTAQYDSAILLSCAINDFHGWNEYSEIGHGEAQPGKWDPGYAPGKMMNMDEVRRDIKARFVKGSKPVSTPDSEDKPAPKSKTYKEVWNTDSMKKPGTHTSDANAYWEPESMLRYAAEQAAQANKKLDIVMKHLGLS
jgi:hypothetical protein